MSYIGALGEKLVKQWLMCHHHRLLQQNWRCRWGEIDLIAQEVKSQAIAFVEVKTRSKFNWDEDGLLAVDAGKQEKIIATAEMFLAEYPQFAELPCSFDVAIVSYIALRSKSINQNTKEILAIDLGVPIVMKQYQLTIENYLKSAFEA